MTSIRCLLLLILLSPIHTAIADELQPAYIQLDQVNGTQWQLRWKSSANSTLGIKGEVILPSSCQSLQTSREFHNGSVFHHTSLTCDADLSGSTVGLTHLASTSTDALVRISPAAAPSITLRLTPEKPVIRIPANPEDRAIVPTYTALGIEHILMGFDHLLFVLGLVLLLKGGWQIFATVTAFTIAHSVTLAGATLNYLSAPGKPVEAVIALSIVFLAAEILKTQPGEERLSQRYPWTIAFMFGLLHGFGFAGALADIGLPRQDTPLALLTFNIGVEIGQLIFVFIILATLKLVETTAGHLLRGLKLSTAYGIGSLATFWLVGRLIS